MHLKSSTELIPVAPTTVDVELHKVDLKCKVMTCSDRIIFQDSYLFTADMNYNVYGKFAQDK